MAVHQKARKLAKQIAKQHVVSALPDMSTNDGKYWCATYIAVESGTGVDTNLSQINIAGKIYRGIPRALYAWTTNPSPGTNLLVLQYGGSFIILCQILGNSQTIGTIQGAGG